MSTSEQKRTPEGSNVVYTETVVEYVDNKRQRIILATILVLLFLLLLGVAASVLMLTRGAGAPDKAEVPKGITWVRSIYGWGKTPETSLNGPSDAAFAPDGSIWVVSASRMIIGFRPDGSLIKVIEPKRGKGEGQVHTLEGIMVGDNNRIYVTDEGKNKVIEFDRSGKWIGEWGVEYPIELAKSNDDKIAVTGSGGVVLVTPEPKLLANWGKRGKGETEFDLPKGIAFTKDGTIIVADTQNQRVRAFDQTGRQKWVIGQSNSGPGADRAAKTPFQLPSGLTIDGAGRIVLVDAFAFKMVVMDPKDGKILASYGENGELDGKFGYPSGIDYDPARDWFVVADTANNRVQILRLAGSGGSPFSALNRLLARPLWVFCLPLILLLIAVVVLVLRRRAERRAAEPAVDEPLLSPDAEAQGGGVEG